MGRPAELADRLDPVEPVAAVDQRLARRARRSPGCTRHKRSAAPTRRRAAATCSFAPARGGSSTTASNRFELGDVERAAEQVAMVDEDAPPRRLQRQRRVARAFGGIDLARPAPARRCRGRRTGRRRSRRLADRLAHRGDQGRLAVRRRLQEGAVRQRHRRAADSVTVTGSGSQSVCGAIAVVEREPGEAVLAGRRRSSPRSPPGPRR